MKKSILCFLCLAILMQPIWSQTTKALEVSSPEAAGFSAQRLKRLDTAMIEWVKKEWMNGGVALIIRNGKVVYYKAAGYNDMTARTALQKEGIFRIASQTKAITSVAAMMLFEEGKLLLTDPVSRFIPSFAKQTVLDKFNGADSTYTTVPASRDITIHDLLTHTSGLGYAQIGSKEANAIYAKSHLTAGLGVTDESLLNAMTRLGTLPLMHQPGARWTYGLNSDLLGCIVEIVSGMSLSDFFRSRIFEPLGMADSYFQVPAAKASRIVNLYTEDSTGHLVKFGENIFNGKALSDYPTAKSEYYSGGAGLSSTIYDYGIFLQTLLNGGEYNGKRILSRNTIRMMTMNQIGDLSLGDNKFGLGFQVETGKGSAATPAQVGTYGWGGAFSTSYWVDPKEKIVLLFYRQLLGGTHGDVVEKFRALTYQAIVD